MYLTTKVIITQGDCILVLRLKTKRERVFWDFPGGKLRKGETFQGTAMREVKEKTGYDVKISKKLYQDTKTVVFSAQVTDGSLINWEKRSGQKNVLSAKWISIKDLRRMQDMKQQISALKLEEALGVVEAVTT